MMLQNSKIPECETLSRFLRASVSISGIDGHQFQTLQQRAGFGDELDVTTSRARQNGVSGVSGCQASSHQLVPFKTLFAAQAAHSFLKRVRRDAARHLDGWFHRFLRSGIPERLRWRSFPSAMSVARQRIRLLRDAITLV